MKYIKLEQFLNNLSTTLFLSISIILVFMLGFIDYITGVEFSFSIFYLLPISLVSWHIGKKAGIIISILSATMWFLADFIGEHIYSSTLFLIWNTFMRLGVFIIISLLISNFKINLLKIHQKELALQKQKTIVETFQKLALMIVDSITIQNSEIIKWVNEKKEKAKVVPEVLEKSSTIIGESLQILSEVSFVSPYVSNAEIDPDKYLEILKERLMKTKKLYLKK